MFLIVFQGLWGQRLWQKFQRVPGREFIEFDEFIYSFCKLPTLYLSLSQVIYLKWLTKDKKFGD